MDERPPSKTAFEVAVLRALHQRIETPKVFDDPYAIRILGSKGEEVIAAAASNAARTARLRAGVVARSRIAEDTVAQAVSRGVRQYVLLGAGLDTYAYRNTVPDLRIFEVDQPATQAWKRALAHDAALAPPPGLAYAAVEFGRHALDEALRVAGFRFDRPAVFAALGVVPYVAQSDFVATLRIVASVPDAEIVFDYPEPFVAAAPPVRAAYEAITKRASASGEPWISFFTPDEIGGELRGLGFLEISDLGTVELNARYFGGRSDGFVAAPLIHILQARR